MRGESRTALGRVRLSHFREVFVERSRRRRRTASVIANRTERDGAYHRIHGARPAGSMQLTPTTRARRRAGRLDVALLATAAASCSLTLLPHFDPALNIVMKDRTLDVGAVGPDDGRDGRARRALLHALPGDGPARLVRAVVGVRPLVTFTAVTLLLIVLRLDGRSASGSRSACRSSSRPGPRASRGSRSPASSW